MSTKTPSPVQPQPTPDELDADDAVAIGESSPMEEIDADLTEVVNRILPIASIVPHPRNYNLHSDSQLGRLQASDARFGQVRSIVVQAGAPGVYLLIAGHGYTEARKARGKSYIKADIIPAHWTAEQVEGYMVADNELARMGESDPELLAAILKDQQDAGQDLLTVGFDEASYNDLVRSLEEEQPPDLDDLEEQYSQPPEHTAFWPMVRLQVPQGVKDLLDSLMAQMPGEDEARKFAALLSCVDVAAAVSLDQDTLETLFAERVSDDEDDGDDDDFGFDEDEMDDYGDDGV